MTKFCLAVAGMMVVGALCERATAQDRGLPEPPPTRIEEAVEQLHGTTVRDPYRWLEAQDAPATREWLRQQTTYTRAVLDALPHRARIRQLAEAVEKANSGWRPVAAAAGRYFLRRRGEGEREFVWYVREGAHGVDRELPVPAPPDSIVELKSVSRDGQLVAFGVRRGGEDDAEIVFFDVGAGRALSDRLPKNRYFHTYILPDRTGIYYTRRQASGSRIMFHAFGTPVDADREVFGAGYDDSRLIWFRFSEDGRHAVAFLASGAGVATTQVFIMDRADGETFRPLITDVAAYFTGFFGGDHLFLHTTWNAPNGRVLAIDLRKPVARDRWREVVPESTQVLIGVEPAAGHLVVLSMENVNSKLRVVTADGSSTREIPQPTFGMLGMWTFGWEQPDFLFQFTAAANPIVYGYEVVTGRQWEWSRAAAAIDTEDLDVKQVWFASKDGTRVPMFVLARKGVVLDGNRPTILSGYGGYGTISLPFFAAETAVWLQAGGVYAWANIRGGGELGEAWHKDGMLSRKQNSFDDFIAAAEWLIANKYTRPDRLATTGGSNGGMLVTVAAVQRPDLFRAVVARNAHLDMVRFHKFMAAAPWVREYGSPEVADEFAYLYRYSPYHRVEEGRRYPAMLFVTGDADTRVAPLHSRKMTARMQAVAAKDRPVLLRYDATTGHSQMTAADRIEQLVDELSFLVAELQVQLTR